MSTYERTFYCRGELYKFSPCENRSFCEKHEVSVVSHSGNFFTTHRLVELSSFVLWPCFVHVDLQDYVYTVAHEASGPSLESFFASSAMYRILQVCCGFSVPSRDTVVVVIRGNVV